MRHPKNRLIPTAKELKSKLKILNRTKYLMVSKTIAGIKKKKRNHPRSCHR